MNKKFIGISNKAIRIGDAVYDCDLDLPFVPCRYQEIIISLGEENEEKLIITDYRKNIDGTYTLKVLNKQ